jgi:hypothetical protein
MHILLIFAIVLFILGLALWTLSLHFMFHKNGFYPIFLIFSLFIFWASIWFACIGTKMQTTDDVIKYLAKQSVIEIQITETDNEVIYVLTPEADSTGWRPLYDYLKGNK